jgi:hypothetical protein
MAVSLIPEARLAEIISGQLRAAEAAGTTHIRNPTAFTRHLLEVATRGRAVAERLHRILPESEAPDPMVAFVAGAWHDGGKIRTGDDYHEVTSALDLLEHGLEWQLVRGPADDAMPILVRAARAILSGFAMHEQWHPTYRPTFTPRADFEQGYARLALALVTALSGVDRDSALLLPVGVDALVVMYADICVGVEDDTEFAQAFDSRWRDIEGRARAGDPGLLRILPAVQPRVREGCALVHRWLTGDWDPAALSAYRAVHCRPVSFR